MLQFVMFIATNFYIVNLVKKSFIKKRLFENYSKNFQQQSKTKCSRKKLIKHPSSNALNF